jgi:hypothetical protein
MKTVCLKGRSFGLRRLVAAFPTKLAESMPFPLGKPRSKSGDESPQSKDPAAH